MVRLGHPLSPNDLKLKVGEIFQTREIPFKHGILGGSWLKLFQQRHPTLVLRIPQPLEVNRARNLCPSIVHTFTFYFNLEHLYKQENYQPSYIWNVDEFEANARRNGVGRVFAPGGFRNVHTIIPNEREWISILTTINAQGDTIPNFYIFKFSKRMDHFLAKLREKGLLSIGTRHLLILNGHKAYLILEVVTKAKWKRVDMLTLPSYTSHGL